MRESGILMPVSSLPGPYGIGCFGKAALEFVDFLAEAGQTIWQILPLSPTGYGDSPYQSCSAFAGNPYFIDLDALKAEGLLTAAQLKAEEWGKNPLEGDYGPLYPYAGTVINAAEWEGGPFRYDSLTYGLMTRAGELVTESVYTRVEVPTYYDREGTDVFLPLLVLKKSVGEGGWPYGDGTLLAVAARDGSWRTPARWWTYAAGAEGLILYGPEGCCWLGTDGTVQGEWPWEELVAVPEMAAEVMNWERLMFEPTWRDDLVWMGWTDESRSRNRLLDLSLGRVREEEPGEWRAIQDTWLVGRGEGYTYFDGEDTFDGSCTRLEIGGQICEIPYGGTELYCTLKRGLLFFNDSSSRQSSPSGAVYRLDGMPVVEAGTYTSISLVRDEMGEEGPVLLMGERTDGSCDLLDEDGALWMEDVPSYTYPYLTGEILQLEEKVSGRQVVSCYDTRTGELLYRRTLGLGDDQQEPLEDW